MELERTLPNKFAEKLGFITAYFVFTTILFYILRFFRRIPQSWTYFHVIIITLIITLIGVIVKRYLK